MKLIVFGDIHMNVDHLEHILALPEADSVIINGDLTNFGGIADAQQIVATVQRYNPKVLAQAGNLDQPEVNNWLEAEGINLHCRARRLAGFWLVGLAGSNPTPFHTPTEFSEKELAKLAEQGFQQTQGEQLPTLFISHCPPLNTNVDRISSGIHVGSIAVRKAIEKHQPALCITGHIHEARGKDVIGKTIIYNPGMLQEGGWLEIDFDPATTQFRTQLH